VPIRGKKAYTIAEALRIHLFGRVGCPRELISDNAAEFTGEVMKSQCAQYNIRKIETAAYHPQSNGLVERVDSKIGRALRSYVNTQSEEWDVLISEIMSSINTCFNASIGDNSHFAMFAFDKNTPSYIDETNSWAVVYNYDDYY
ncbi:Integrase catalytic core, partial [Trinorchestia longiramus]